ncbi:DUF4293 domain-containing protein [Flavobacteriaceae bacterium]|nr:DUF4293 domain-containing protein [Flavobacteriaceae bacterium]MDA9977736.1 DUF4293 domain-containing protein [Flavobacteriaceae bacterium]MDB4050024.1 DUF4293 domain-containing protein [Flavobacteriaceae bacterium]MDB4131071.1 DUF4293 domain-containing protein [Flavobacteriaceae bacterium]MDB4240197.1 DUF4293 domain-containing protein [Flavobacteriaceae bacterium]
MIQRIQSLYMLLLFVLNIIVVISIDSDPSFSLAESYFGFFRPYLNDYFYSEILALTVIINIFLFKKPNVQIIVLRILFLTLIFGLLNLFDERSLAASFKDPGLLYFITSFLLILMSVRSIKNDQAIIRSSNRLR